MRNAKIEYNRTTENIEIIARDPVTNRVLTHFKFKKTDDKRNRESFKFMKDKYDFIPLIDFPPKKSEDKDLDWLK